MFSRSLRMVLIVAGLSILIACDPETVIKSKVPQPLQKALTFGPQGTGPKSKQIQTATVEIVAPKSGAAYPAGKEIIFQGKVKMAAESKQEKPELVWTLFPEKNPTGVPLGKGNSVKKQLHTGNYRAELAMVQEGRKISKNVNFLLKFPYKLKTFF